MNWLDAVLVAVGGAIGAPARFLLDAWLQARHRAAMPWGTFAVNVLGSFVLGLVAAAVHRGGLPPGWLAGLGVGFCGALTTFSTFAVETVRLVESGRARLAAGYVAGSLAAGLLALSACWACGRLI